MLRNYIPSETTQKTEYFSQEQHCLKMIMF